MTGDFEKKFYSLTVLSSKSKLLIAFKFLSNKSFMKVNKILKEQGWKVVRFWGKDIQKNLNACIDKIEKEIGVQ